MCTIHTILFYKTKPLKNGLFLVLPSFQVDLSGREEVYSLMGYSVFSSKAFIFYKKCQICYLSGKVALKDKNSDRSGNNLNSKFTRGFLALTINLIW